MRRVWSREDRNWPYMGYGQYLHVGILSLGKGSSTGNHRGLLKGFEPPFRLMKGRFRVDMIMRGLHMTSQQDMDAIEGLSSGL